MAFKKKKQKDINYENKKDYSKLIKMISLKHREEECFFGLIK